MALRSFFAQDSANLVVTSSSDGAIVGDPIINNSDTPNGTEFIYSTGGGTEVTLDDTGGNRNRFDDDNPGNHVITDGGGLVANGTGVEAESRIFVRAVDNSGNLTGPTITITVFSQGGVTSDVWGFASDTLLQDGVTYRKTGGSNSGSTRYSDFMTCFAEGTHIETVYGSRKIEDISVGDFVLTRDNGAQKLCWIGSTETNGYGKFAPVVFEKGAIGNSNTLRVSQEHRMFWNQPKTQILFGAPEVLVAAKHLVGLPGVTLAATDHIRYFHLMFDQHQLICSNGAWSESFYFSKLSYNAQSMNAQAELRALFPELCAGTGEFGEPVCPVLARHEAALLQTDWQV